jgi:hypothetical protein
MTSQNFGTNLGMILRLSWVKADGVSAYRSGTAHEHKWFYRQWNNFDGENDELDKIKILHYTDMSTQMHAKYALPRLEAKGWKHWFDGEFREHRRQDVQDLFDGLYNEAMDAGYTPEKYESKQWIPYQKESQKGYRASNGFDVTRGE